MELFRRFWKIFKEDCLVPTRDKFPIEIVTVREYCEAKGDDYYLIEAPRTNCVSATRVLGVPPYGTVDVTYNLPPIFTAKLQSCTVIGREDIILGPKGQCIADEIAECFKDGYSIKGRAVSGPPWVLDESQNSLSAEHMNSAIHLLSSSPENWFHFLIEEIPRLLLLSSSAMPFKIPHDVPLLVDAGLPKQCLRALEIANTAKHPILQVQANQKLSIGTLYYPSRSSRILNNYSAPLDFSNDIAIDQVVLQNIRKVFQRHEPDQTISRRLYVSRSGTVYRFMWNADDVELWAIRNKFEIIHPDRLSFDIQVELFGQAELVIAEAGAAVGNMIFMKPGTKMIVLGGNNARINYYCFQQLAEGLKIKLIYVAGYEVPDSFKMAGVHNNFSVPLDFVEEAFRQMSIL